MPKTPRPAVTSAATAASSSTSTSAPARRLTRGPQASTDSKAPVSSSGAVSKSVRGKSHSMAPSNSGDAPTPDGDDDNAATTASDGEGSAKSNQTAQPAQATPWNHPAELAYIRREDWPQSTMIEYLHQNAFTIPPRDANSSVPTFSITKRDGSAISLPRGYRVPLLFLAKFQWDSLWLVLTATDPEKEWEEYRFDIIHLSRLCTHLFTEAKEAGEAARLEGKKGLDKGWRCALFDRVLTRFWHRWFLSRAEWVKKFWEEFDEEEYELDVLKNDWVRWAYKGHKGFRLEKDEVQNGITLEAFTRGLYKDPQSKWHWTSRTTPAPEQIATETKPALASTPAPSFTPSIPPLPQSSSGREDPPTTTAASVSLAVTTATTLPPPPPSESAASTATPSSAIDAYPNEDVVRQRSVSTALSSPPRTPPTAVVKMKSASPEVKFIASKGFNSGSTLTPSHNSIEVKKERIDESEALGPLTSTSTTSLAKELPKKLRAPITLKSRRDTISDMQVRSDAKTTTTTKSDYERLTQAGTPPTVAMGLVPSLFPSVAAAVSASASNIVQPAFASPLVAPTADSSTPLSKPTITPVPAKALTGDASSSSSKTPNSGSDPRTEAMAGTGSARDGATGPERRARSPSSASIAATSTAPANATAGTAHILIPTSRQAKPPVIVEPTPPTSVAPVARTNGLFNSTSSVGLNGHSSANLNGLKRPREDEEDLGDGPDKVRKIGSWRPGTIIGGPRRSIRVDEIVQRPLTSTKHPMLVATLNHPVHPQPSISNGHGGNAGAKADDASGSDMDMSSLSSIESGGEDDAGRKGEGMAMEVDKPGPRTEVNGDGSGVVKDKDQPSTRPEPSPSVATTTQTPTPKHTPTPAKQSAIQEFLAKKALPSSSSGSKEVEKDVTGDGEASVAASHDQPMSPLSASTETVTEVAPLTAPQKKQSHTNRKRAWRRKEAKEAAAALAAQSATSAVAPPSTSTFAPASLPLSASAPTPSIPPGPIPPVAGPTAPTPSLAVVHQLVDRAASRASSAPLGEPGPSQEGREMDTEDNGAAARRVHMLLKAGAGGAKRTADDGLGGNEDEAADGTKTTSVNVAAKAETQSSTAPAVILESEKETTTTPVFKSIALALNSNFAGSVLEQEAQVGADLKKSMPKNNLQPTLATITNRVEVPPPPPSVLPPPLPALPTAESMASAKDRSPAAPSTPVLNPTTTAAALKVSSNSSTPVPHPTTAVSGQDIEKPIAPSPPPSNGSVAAPPNQTEDKESDDDMDVDQPLAATSYLQGVPYSISIDNILEGVSEAKALHTMHLLRHLLSFLRVSSQGTTSITSSAADPGTGGIVDMVESAKAQAVPYALGLSLGTPSLFGGEAAVPLEQIVILLAKASVALLKDLSSFTGEEIKERIESIDLRLANRIEELQGPSARSTEAPLSVEIQKTQRILVEREMETTRVVASSSSSKGVQVGDVSRFGDERPQDPLQQLAQGSISKPTRAGSGPLPLSPDATMVDVEFSTPSFIPPSTPMPDLSAPGINSATPGFIDPFKVEASAVSSAGQQHFSGGVNGRSSAALAMAAMMRNMADLLEWGASGVVSSGGMSDAVAASRKGKERQRDGIDDAGPSSVLAASSSLLARSSSSSSSSSSMLPPLYDSPMVSALLDEFRSLKDELRQSRLKNLEDIDDVRREMRDKGWERERELDRERARERDKAQERQREREREEDDAQGGLLPTLEILELRRRIAALEAGHGPQSRSGAMTPASAGMEVSFVRKSNHPLGHLLDYEETRALTPIQPPASAAAIGGDGEASNPVVGNANFVHAAGGVVDVNDSIPLPIKSQRKFSAFHRPSVG